MKLRNMLSTTICLVFIAASGCVSQEEQARQQAQIQAAAQQAEQVKQNWPKLSEGLTIQQVIELMPIIRSGSKNVSWAESIGPGGVLINYTIRLNTGIYVLNFKNDNLASWTPR